jgi:hypothetical protein
VTAVSVVPVLVGGRGIARWISGDGAGVGIRSLPRVSVPVAVVLGVISPVGAGRRELASAELASAGRVLG